MFKFVELFHNKGSNVYTYNAEDSTTVQTPVLQNTEFFVKKKSFTSENLNMFITYAPCFMDWNSPPQVWTSKSIWVAAITYITYAKILETYMCTHEKSMKYDSHLQNNMTR
jgi:hypothetical protein